MDIIDYRGMMGGVGSEGMGLGGNLAVDLVFVL